MRDIAASPGAMDGYCERMSAMLDASSLELTARRAAIFTHSVMSLSGRRDASTLSRTPSDCGKTSNGSTMPIDLRVLVSATIFVIARGAAWSALGGGAD